MLMLKPAPLAAQELPASKQTSAGQYLAAVEAKPLPVLTVEKPGGQRQRCSALHAAAQLVFEAALPATDEARKKARLQVSRARAKGNGDGLLVLAVLVVATQEHMSNAEAANIVMEAHHQMIADCLRSLGGPDAGPSLFAYSPFGSMT